MGFSANFLAWAKLSYNNPEARVHTGAVVSQSVPTERGTRQGCLLLPLLFALAMEPLAIR